KFAFYMLGEYAMMIVNSCLMVTLFFGGWSLGMGGVGLTTEVLRGMGIWGGLLGTLIFATKVLLFLFVYIWFRATFPRFRFDQLMDLGWKYLIPLALANIFVTGVILLAFPPRMYGETVIAVGETILTVIGVLTIIATLALLFRPKPKPKVIDARRVSEA
ncbi:MAG TPA: NADH-quinone oxidoreductase subunit H, partial [Thermoanaerobaculia bacterium]